MSKNTNFYIKTKGSLKKLYSSCKEESRHNSGAINPFKEDPETLLQKRVPHKFETQIRLPMCEN